MTFVVLLVTSSVDDIWRIHYIFKHHFGGLYPIAVEVGATDDSAGCVRVRPGTATLKRRVRPATDSPGKGSEKRAVC
jgi:hypothetical protein